MRVLVTGATGFIGSHTAAAVSAAGHDVRVLVRNPARLSGSLGPHGLDPEVVVGDMTDPAAAARAVEGCDAVIHAAAQVGVGGGGAADDTNVTGVRTVIGAAIGAGVGRIAYTSSITVHTPCDARAITLDSPLVEPMSPYGASKRAAEEIVRSWQDDGHPVTVVVPGGVYGPQAPDLISSFHAVLSALDVFMLVPPTGTTVLDVRDLALLLTRIVEHPDPGPRVLAGGHFLTWSEWVAELEVAVGRPVANQVVTREELMAMAEQLTAMAAETGEEPLLGEEAAIVMSSGVPIDDAASLARFGVEARPVADTFADVIAFLREIGRIPPAA